jgi:predicted MFS family arabinose efflux permease
MTLNRIVHVFLPFAFGFYLSYFYRSVNAIIAPDLIEDIGLNAASLGLLSSAYFISFAAFQIPLGIILDRFGPRKVESTLLILAALGAGVFAASETLSSLIIGRALIGLGVSACLMASFKSFVDWFPREQLPIFNGAMMMAGGLGALTATAPIEFISGFTDWRGIFWVLSILTLISSFIIFYVVPEPPIDRKIDGDSTLREQISGLMEVIRNPIFQRYVPFSVTSQAAMLALQGLWIGPWLRDVGGFTRAETASGLLIMAVALAIGFLSWGVIGARLGRYGVSPMKISLVGVGVFLILQVIVILEPIGFILPIVFLLGFFGTAGSLSYVGLIQNFSKHLSGRVYTTANLMIFLLAFLGQWGIGIIIDLWPYPGGGGFSPFGYQISFAVVLSVQVIAFLWIVLSKFILRQIK